METFGLFSISEEYIVYKTELSFVFTNLKPALEGHLLISPRRVVQFARDLREDERADLLATAELAQLVMRRVINVDIMQVTLQDGPEAGQTVPHVHLHILPRPPVPQWASVVQPHEVRAALATKYAAAFSQYLESTRRI
jgi:bis(5'-adenosyl)-triphosphatase